MDKKLDIHLEIAGKTYGLTIEREKEELARAAAKQIRDKISQYRRYFSVKDVDEKDLLAMVAFQLSMTNLRLENQNDTVPFEEKMKQLNGEIEAYLKQR